MPRATLIHALLFLLVFAQCGKTQDAERKADRKAAVKDSLARVKWKAAAKDRFVRALDQVESSVKKTIKLSDADRLVNAEYATFKTLAILIRSLDSSSVVHGEVREEEARLLKEDSTRVGPAGKITNGMLGLYSLYGLLYRMRFAHSHERLETYDSIQAGVRATIRPDVPAIEAVAAMANGMYRMALRIVEDIDREHAYAGQFEVIAGQYEDGAKSAETDEDRLLNGIYRTFEVSQVWALYLDPTGKEELSNLNRELYSATKSAEGIGAQLAVGMEFLYRIHDIIARRSVRLSY